MNKDDQIDIMLQAIEEAAGMLDNHIGVRDPDHLQEAMAQASKLLRSALPEGTMHPDAPHLWPAQDCGKCGQPVGGETIHSEGRFYHPACLGIVAGATDPGADDDEECPF